MIVNSGDISKDWLEVRDGENLRVQAEGDTETGTCVIIGKISKDSEPAVINLIREGHDTQNPSYDVCVFVKGSSFYLGSVGGLYAIKASGVDGFTAVNAIITR